MQQSNFIIFIGLLFARKENEKNFDFCVEYEVLRKKKVEVAKKVLLVNIKAIKKFEY